jgi:hypothetical protein
MTVRDSLTDRPSHPIYARPPRPNTVHMDTAGDKRSSTAESTGRHTLPSSARELLVTAS